MPLKRFKSDSEKPLLNPSLVSVYANLLLVFCFVLKLNLALYECEKCEVLTHANAFACIDGRTSLSENVVPGNIILRQRGSSIYAGAGVGMGKDYTLFALVEGKVKFEQKTKDKKQVSVYAD